MKPGKEKLAKTAGACLVFLFLLNACSQGEPLKSMPSSQLDGIVAAPDFPPDLDWLNTDKPLSLQALRGKIVLLDFWTFCCINCMHVIPDLKKLEEKYPNELVVIGVHSAKFQNEKGTESIRQAILRNEIKHPVINDGDMEVWSEYGVHSWPTLVLIAPNGKIIGMQPGEGVFDLFDRVIAKTIEHYDQKGELKRGPLNLALEAAKQPQTLLSFPGKVKADPVRGRLFISDSNHNRIVVTDAKGKVLEVIGSGKMGTQDGSFEDAEFHHPQGVFPDGDLLYIADTENHLIRRADLKARSVQTLFGNGRQARETSFQGAGTQVSLNSPWDLLLLEGKLYVAMAGAHQLYMADLKSMDIKPFAGSGQEARIDGPLLGAALAQPSGIATDGKKLYFADSEVSSVRSADLDPSGKVDTLIGEDLFVFGDVDGDRGSARLQHAIGVETKDGSVYVADTYNSKIKVIDPVKKTSRTLAGTGKHWFKDGPFGQAEFFEPAGLSFWGDQLYVADTNNHQIRVLDLPAGQVRTLEIKGLQAAARGKKAEEFKGHVVEMAPQVLQQGKGTISLKLGLPRDFHFNEEAPFHMDWKTEEGGILNFPKGSEWNPSKISFPLEIPVESSAGKTRLVFDARIYYCGDKSSLCLFDQVRIRVPVEVKAEGPGKMELQLELPVKTPKE